MADALEQEPFEPTRDPAVEAFHAGGDVGGVMGHPKKVPNLDPVPASAPPVR